jgi:hypothetical protein
MYRKIDLAGFVVRLIRVLAVSHANPHPTLARLSRGRQVAKIEFHAQSSSHGGRTNPASIRM